MSLVFSEDVAPFSDSIRDVYRAQSTRETILAHMASGAPYDAALWGQVGQLGWLAAGVSEDYEGLGLGFESLAALYYETGMATAPIPLLGTMLAADVIARAGSAEHRRTYLPRIAQGALIGAISSPLEATPFTIDRVEGNTVWLSGNGIIADGAAADLFALHVRDPQGRSAWILLDRAQDGVSGTAVTMWDQTRSFGQLDLDGIEVPADRLLGSFDTDAVADHAAIALACDSLGAAQAVFDLTLDYLKTRQQFGKIIGSFQALKHRCADHQGALVAASTLVLEAIEMVGVSPPDPAAASASLTKAFVCEIAREVGRDAVQLHGGIGFTWEHACHLYLKRTLLNEALFGGRASAYDRASTLLAA